MRKEHKPYLHLTLSLFGAAALSILFFFLIFRLKDVGGLFSRLIAILTPFIIGSVIAYILTPLCNRLERALGKRLKKRKSGTKAAKGLSILLTLLIAIAVITVLIMLVVPRLVTTITSVLLEIPDSIQAFRTWAVNLVGDNEALRNYVNDLADAVSSWLPNWVSSYVLPSLESLIGGIYAGAVSAIGVIYDTLIGLIVSIYFLGNRKVFARQGRKLVRTLFKKEWADQILNEFTFANKMFSGFLFGRVVDSLIIGVICFLVMLILQIPDAVLVSVIVGVTNIIPFFGPYIGAIPSFLIILMSNPVKAVVFLVFVLILQQFDGNILGPRILGNVTGLNSFWVLFSILLFGGLFGFIGMIIGVPVFAVIYDILVKLINRGYARRQKQAEEPQPPEEEP